MADGVPSVRACASQHTQTAHRVTHSTQLFVFKICLDSGLEIKVRDKVGQSVLSVVVVNVGVGGQ